MERKKLTRALVVGFSVFLITLVLYYLGAFQILEWKSWDLRLNLWSHPEKAGKDIVLIFIDQPSLDAYAEEQGISWPWPRQMYAYMLDFLQQAGARAVVFDLIFSEASVWGVEDDLQFAQAMSQAQNAFLPVFMSGREETSVLAVPEAFQRYAWTKEDLPPQAIYPTESVSLPVDELLENCRGIGNVQFPSDKDGIYRRMPLVYSLGDRIYPSLPLSIVGFLDESFEIGAVPLDRSGQLILNYFGPTRIYTAFSAAAVINSLALLRQGQDPQIRLSAFKDKIVLLGGSAPGLLDLRPTPLSPVSPGVGIHATAIDNLLHKEFIRVPSALVVIFIVALLSVLTALGTTLITKIRHLVLFTLLCVCVPGLLIWVSFKAGFWLTFVAPEFAVLLSFAMATLLNYQI
ncbi:MAG: CHASE2 domain-containing protein, partial [Candidatus Aminicenantes bacterium]|nr:CHASE2 domain-containing protein [Candidatus Aminicenantes bacterium]